MCCQELLKQWEWLSVRQLVFFHSVVQIYKTVKTTYPKYINSKLCMEFPYNTRLAQSDSVRMGDAFKSKLDLTEKSFMNRATVSFNQLPQDLRKKKEIGAFKVELKKWILENYKQWELQRKTLDNGEVLPPSLPLVEVYLLLKMPTILYHLQLRKKL